MILITAKNKILQFLTKFYYVNSTCVPIFPILVLEEYMYLFMSNQERNAIMSNLRDMILLKTLKEREDKSLEETLRYLCCQIMKSNIISHF